MPRIAKSLDVFRSEMNALYPGRSKLSDGWIGDTAHAARPSDHNPNAAGVVTALDITHDPGKGPDTWALAETLRVNRDPRIKYVISNGRIFAGAGGPSPWIWRPYTGANKHAHHVHVSVLADRADDASPWKFDAPATVPRAPEPPKPKGIDNNIRTRMMKTIMGYEGKIPPVVFWAPDGNPEIAGITRKDHPGKYAELKGLLDAGNTAALTDAVVAYYLAYTAPAQNWTDRAGLEFFLRDCILNRGPTGAAEILQMAVGADIDHQIGPTTRGALAALDFDNALGKLRAARERYEDKKYPARRGSGQWQGMLNRWNKATDQARAFQREQGMTPVKSPEGAAAGGAVVIGGGTVAAVAKSSWTWADIGMAAFSVGIAALVVFLIVRSLRRRS